MNHITLCKETSGASHISFLSKVTTSPQVPKTDDGLEAIVFTAQGDMRQALNNLQSTFDGFAFVNADNVFKVNAN